MVAAARVQTQAKNGIARRSKNRIGIQPRGKCKTHSSAKETGVPLAGCSHRHTSHISTPWSLQRGLVRFTPYLAKAAFARSSAASTCSATGTFAKRPHQRLRRRAAHRFARRLEAAPSGGGRSVSGIAPRPLAQRNPRGPTKASVAHAAPIPVSAAGTVT